MMKCEKEKKNPLYVKKHKECNASITLHYTKMLCLPKITNETKSDHNFLHPRQHKNVPVTIVVSLVNSFLTDCVNHCRPSASREPFADVSTVKSAVNIVS